MPVPVLDLKRQYAAIKDEIDAAILDVVASAQFVLGPHVKAFEEAAADYCGAKHAIGVASGTDALLLSLKALDIGPGDSVILPSFTFFATAGVVHNVGATPVFCDIDPQTFNLDPDHLRHILEGARGSSHVVSGDNSKSFGSEQGSSSTSYAPQATSRDLRFRAVIPVHLYGQIADMDEITAIAKEFGLAVVEDAAQAIGAEYWKEEQQVAGGTLPVGTTEADRTDEVPPQATLDKPQASSDPLATNHKLQAAGSEPSARSAGTLGDLGCFSFYPTKNLGAYGDGGMITTNDDELADKIRMLRVHGAKPKYFHRMVGFNSRLDAIQAAILSVKLRHLDAWSTARGELADRYDEDLSGLEGLITPFRAETRSHIFHQYTIRVLNGRRDELREHLKEQGIGTMIYYPIPLHLQDCFSHLECREGQLPQSESASHEVLSLPIFPELTAEEQENVIESMRTFFG